MRFIIIFIFLSFSLLSQNLTDNNVSLFLYNQIDSARVSPISYCLKYSEKEAFKKMWIDTIKNNYYKQELDFELCSLARLRCLELLKLNYGKHPKQINKTELSKISDNISIKISHNTEIKRILIDNIKESITLNYTERNKESEFLSYKKSIANLIDDYHNFYVGLGHREHILNLNNNHKKIGIAVVYIGETDIVGVSKIKSTNPCYIMVILTQ
jgi:hypothetical protein